MYPKSNVKLSSCTTTHYFMTPTRHTGKVKLEQCCIYHSASALWDLLRGHGAGKNLRQPDFNQQMLSTANPHCRGWSEPVLPRTDWASAQSPVHTYTAGHRHRLQPLHWWYPWQPANDSGSHADTSHINLVIRPTFSDESISLSLQLYLYLRFKYLLDVMAGIKVQRNIFIWILMWKWISLVELCHYTITNLHEYSITLTLRLNTCNSCKVNIHLFSYFIYYLNMLFVCSLCTWYSSSSMIFGRFSITRKGNKCVESVSKYHITCGKWVYTLVVWSNRWRSIRSFRHRALKQDLNGRNLFLQNQQLCVRIILWLAASLALYTSVS